MIKTIVYKKDIEDLYNQYLNSNTGNIPTTLKKLEEDKKLPISFMRYFETDEDFRKHFNIDKKTYFENCNYQWIDQHIFPVE